MSDATDYFFTELRAHLKCAVCRTRVQKVERVYDGAHAVETAVVHCHGQTEVIAAPSVGIEALMGAELRSLGDAFEPSRGLGDRRDLQATFLKTLPGEIDHVNVSVNFQRDDPVEILCLKCGHAVAGHPCWCGCVKARVRVNDPGAKR